VHLSLSAQRLEHQAEERAWYNLIHQPKELTDRSSYFCCYYTTDSSLTIFVEFRLDGSPPKVGGSLRADQTEEISRDQFDHMLNMFICNDHHVLFTSMSIRKFVLRSIELSLPSMSRYDVEDELVGRGSMLRTGRLRRKILSSSR
jgi:hypothetical protein